MTEENYLTEKEVSAITKIALSTLRNQRHLCTGIPYAKIGKSVRYRATDVMEYMESHMIRVGR